MATLSERLMKVALLGRVPDDDQHVIADADAEIERLRAALAEYGDHLYGCALQEERPCSCGYEAALGGVADEQKEHDPPYHSIEEWNR